LKEAGIDKNLAHQARQLGALSDQQFEQTVAETRAAVTSAGSKRVKSKRQARERSREVADDAAPESDAGSDSEMLEVGREAVEKLMAEKRALEARISELERELEELRGKLAGTGGDMSISEFQIAHKQWEEAFETQRGIIARLEKDNANLRAAKRELEEIIAAQAADDALPPADNGAPCDSEDADLVDAYAQRGCNDDEVPDIPEPAPLPAAAPPANDGLDISECLRR